MPDQFKQLEKAMQGAEATRDLIQNGLDAMGARALGRSARRTQVLSERLGLDVGDDTGSYLRDLLESDVLTGGSVKGRRKKLKKFLKRLGIRMNVQELEALARAELQRRR